MLMILFRIKVSCPDVDGSAIVRKMLQVSAVRIGSSWWVDTYFLYTWYSFAEDVTGVSHPDVH